jgi:hypothetical protein
MNFFCGPSGKIARRGSFCMHIFLFVYFQSRGLPLILTLRVFQENTIHFSLQKSLKFPDRQKVTLLKICIKNILLIEKSQS